MKKAIASSTKPAKLRERAALEQDLADVEGLRDQRDALLLGVGRGERGRGVEVDPRLRDHRGGRRRGVELVAPLVKLALALHVVEDRPQLLEQLEVLDHLVARRSEQVVADLPPQRRDIGGGPPPQPAHHVQLEAVEAPSG
ncbi:hypothetical protein OV079_49470 [Nannocystis pusilla]|uniref:Uncharacterized protein n=1 Tax=Nannocystis pusilla TaxID=889268 RepID=A0A9X3F189_9BACT|nr:hypothetical protein [Nannocystis pusilla]MCY1013430.1 hypothetical protein [Nannocystis pusilla]